MGGGVGLCRRRWEEYAKDERRCECRIKRREEAVRCNDYQAWMSE